MNNKINSQHVVKDDDKWAVKKGGSIKATKLFDTQEKAIEWGRNVAKNQKAEFYIHDRNGKICTKESYGK
jgi:hypothetical protein